MPGGAAPTTQRANDSGRCTASRMAHRWRGPLLLKRDRVLARVGLLFKVSVCTTLAREMYQRRRHSPA